MGNVFNVVKDPEVSEEVLLEVAYHGDVRERTLLAERAELPESVVRVLCRDEDEKVISTVLQKSEGTTIPEDVLLELAHYGTVKVKIAVACHQGLSAEVVSILANDKRSLVLEYVAERCALPEDVIERFIDTYSSDRWQSLMMNRRFFPVEAVERLWLLNQRTRNYEDVNRFAMIRLVTDERTPLRLFEELAVDNFGAYYLPSNPACPVEVIEKLTQVEGLEAMVRRKIAVRLVEDSPRWKGMPVEWVEAAAFKD